MSVPPDNRRPRSDGEHTRALILTFLQGYHAEHKRAPTYAEIGSAVGIARSVAFHHVQRLRRDGAVTIAPGSRGILLQGGAV